MGALMVVTAVLAALAAAYFGEESCFERLERVHLSGDRDAIELQSC